MQGKHSQTASSCSGSKDAFAFTVEAGRLPALATARAASIGLEDDDDDVTEPDAVDTSGVSTLSLIHI